MSSHNEPPVVHLLPAEMRSPRRIVSLSVVEARTGLSAVEITSMVASGRFPPPRMVTPAGRVLGWDEEDVNDWIIGLAPAPAAAIAQLAPANSASPRRPRKAKAIDGGA